MEDKRWPKKTMDISRKRKQAYSVVAVGVVQKMRELHPGLQAIQDQEVWPGEVMRGHQIDTKLGTKGRIDV